MPRYFPTCHVGQRCVIWQKSFVAMRAAVRDSSFVTETALATTQPPSGKPVKSCLCYQAGQSRKKRGGQRISPIRNATPMARIRGSVPLAFATATSGHRSSQVDRWFSREPPNWSHHPDEGCTLTQHADKCLGGGASPARRETGNCPLSHTPGHQIRTV